VVDYSDDCVANRSHPAHVAEQRGGLHGLASCIGPTVQGRGGITSILSSRLQPAFFPGRSELAGRCWELLSAQEAGVVRFPLLFEKVGPGAGADSHLAFPAFGTLLGVCLAPCPSLPL